MTLSSLPLPACRTFINLTDNICYKDKSRLLGSAVPCWQYPSSPQLFLVGFTWLLLSGDLLIQIPCVSSRSQGQNLVVQGSGHHHLWARFKWPSTAHTCWKLQVEEKLEKNKNKRTVNMRGGFVERFQTSLVFVFSNRNLSSLVCFSVCLAVFLSVCVFMFNCIVLIYCWLSASLVHVCPSLFEYRYILFPWLSVMLTGCCHVQHFTLHIYFGRCFLCKTVKVLTSCCENIVQVHCD